MTTKLTLSLDSRVIERAKRYSQKKGTSLSKLVEAFLERLTSSPARQPKRSIMELKGIGGKVPADFDYKEERYKYLMKKYK
jgi:hypothetical protein